MVFETSNHRFLLSLSGEASNTTAPPPPWLVGVLINSGAIPYSFPASSAPAASAAPTPARETAPHPRASTGDPGARTRGTGGPTPRRRARPPGTETLHHRTHSFPVPASPPARPDPPRPAALPDL